MINQTHTESTLFYLDKTWQTWPQLGHGLYMKEQLRQWQEPILATRMKYRIICICMDVLCTDNNNSNNDNDNNDNNSNDNDTNTNNDNNNNHHHNSLRIVIVMII